MRLTNSFELKTGTLEELNSIITQPGFKGTIANLPAELYHKCAGISRSTLSDLEQSFAHFEERRRNPKKQTKDMIFGSAFHDFTMLPADFARNFCVELSKEDYPGLLETVDDIKAELTKRALPTNGKKKEDHIKTLLTAFPEAPIWDLIKQKHEAENAGKQIITQEEMSRIKVMSNNVHNHPTIRALKTGQVIYEQSFFWRDAETGLLCKCRPDVIFMTPNLFLPADFKTTDDASLKEFQRTIGNFEYHIQASSYLDGINEVLGLALENFLFIPVEKQAPHELALYALDGAAQEVGRQKYKKHLRTLAQYEPGGEKENGWKGYPTEIQNISIPAYLMIEA